MRTLITAAIAAATVAVVAWLTVSPTAGQAQGAFRAKRTVYGDGHPDLNGIWQAVNTAFWDLEDHGQQAGPLYQLGAMGAIPPGQGVVEGGSIPYKPEALAKKKDNFAKRLTADPFNRDVGDPELKCYMPGVPRATYMQYPFQIVQSPKDVLMVYQYASANRIVHMEKHTESPTDTWMGWSNGRWEGDTLVVDVRSLNGQAWLDRAGNFVTDNAHIVERFTPISADHLNYEATIEDSNIFTRPWKISMPLYRRVEKNVQLLDFKCVEFSEEALYGRLRKQPPAAPAN